MGEDAQFTRFCRQAAQDVIAGRLDVDGQPVVEFLDHNPEAVLSLVDLLVAEGRRKRPSDKLIRAYAWMLTYGLEFIRYRVDRNQAPGLQLADAVRQRILQRAAEEMFDPALLMIVLGPFKQAKLEIGEELQQLMARVTEQASRDPAFVAGAGSIADHWADVAEMAEGDPFVLHDQFADQAGILPPAHRAAMAVSMLDTPEAVVREAAVGWLLDGEAVVRTATAGALEREAGAGQLSGTMLRRMITLRNWLPETERVIVDRAIKLCRQREINCASWPAVKVESVIASGLDGSATQSLFVVVKQGRKFALASLLVKHGVGVRDAFIHRKLSRADVNAFLEEAGEKIDLYPATQDHLASTMRHFLAANGRAGVLPPFGLLDLAETVGVADLNPRYMEVDEIVESLCAHMEPKDLTARGVARLLKRSAHWPETYPFIDSWFEADGAIDALMTAEPAPTGDPADVILCEYLPARRRYWAEVFAWTALVLRQPGAGGGWEEFAVTARELLGDCDIASIPVMTIIAAISAEVYRHGIDVDSD